jgi:hypothetical protein
MTAVEVEERVASALPLGGPARSGRRYMREVGKFRLTLYFGTGFMLAG